MVAVRTRRTVLVLDDDGDICDRSRPALEARGYAVLTASDGPTALATMRLTHVDAVLVDLSSRGAVDFLDEKAGDPALAKIPVLVVTVFADELEGAYGNVVAPTLS